MFYVDKLYYLQIGVQGENDATEIQIDMTSWVRMLPSNTTFHVLFKPYNESIPVPMECGYENNILTWTVTLSATRNVGVGYTEIRAINPGGLIKKTKIIPTSVENSVSGMETADPPASYQGWVNQVLAAGSDSEAYARGTRGGSAVGSTDPAYQNNSLYYKNLAETAKEAAETAQGAAEDARDAAQAAAGDFQGIEAEAEGLAADDDPTIEVTHSEGGLYNFAFGIPKGTTFTPSVNAAGDISWTNDGGKTNPATVNIKGPQGDPAPSELVVPAVDSWLGQYITNPSNPPLDASLSEANAAAPANLVGELKSAIRQISIEQDILPTWHQGYIQTSTGNPGVDNNYCYCDYIESNGKQYEITGANGYKVKVARYNSSKVFQGIEVATTSAFPVNFTINEGEFFRIQFGLGDSATTPSSITPSVFTLAYFDFTDTSLSMSGKSADAKATGDAFTRIKTDIYDTKTFTDDLWESGTIISFANADNNTRLRTIGYIPEGCLEIECDSGYQCLVIAYNSANQGIGRINTDGEISTEGTAAWLEFVDLRVFADDGYKYRLLLRRTDDQTMTVEADAGKCHLVYLATVESEDTETVSGTTKRNNIALVGQMKDVADSYYAHRTDQSGGQYVMVYGQTTIFDGAYANRQIDCSTFIGLCLRGIPFESTPYDPSYSGGTHNPDYWIANDDYMWSVNPFDYSQNDGVYSGSCRTAAQIAKWMISQGQQVILDPKMCNLEPGDILFYARKNIDTGEWIQPNRFMHINHISMCYSKTRMNASSPNWDFSRYPYKHELIEVTTVDGAVNKTIVEKDWDNPTNIYDNNVNTLVLVCRPDCGSLAPMNA